MHVYRVNNPGTFKIEAALSYRAWYPYVGNTPSENKNTILYSNLAYTWNILEPINGISSEI